MNCGDYKTVSWYLHSMNFMYDFVVLAVDNDIAVYKHDFSSFLLNCGHLRVKSFIHSGNLAVFICC